MAQPVLILFTQDLGPGADDQLIGVDRAHHIIIDADFHSLDQLVIIGLINKGEDGKLPGFLQAADA